MEKNQRKCASAFKWSGGSDRLMTLRMVEVEVPQKLQIQTIQIK